MSVLFCLLDSFFILIIQIILIQERKTRENNTVIDLDKDRFRWDIWDLLFPLIIFSFSYR